MIRRSSAIAAAALVLSLLAHLAGLGLTTADRTPATTGEGGADVVAMGNAFEEFAEPVSDPVPPEPAPVPEPPVEPQPEPERTEPPTTMALVASDNPQNVLSPDMGEAEVPQPVEADPVEPDSGDGPAPLAGSPEGAEEAARAEPAPAQSVETAPAEEAQAEAVSQPVAPAETEAQATAATPPEAPEQLAALPVQTAPAVPVEPTPEVATIPLTPVETETVDPSTPVATVAPLPETVDPSESDARGDGSELAVLSSPRPQAPTRRPPVRTSPQEVESPSFAGSDNSPLASIMRGEIDYSIFDTRKPRGTGSGGSASRGPGNSDVTNYAGRVLMHLNRAPSVTVYNPGVARVAFEINRDGTLAWVDVTSSTGTHEFDTAARQQVRNASPFPLPPRGAQRRFSFVFRGQ